MQNVPKLPINIRRLESNAPGVQSPAVFMHRTDGSMQSGEENKENRGWNMEGRREGNIPLGCIKEE